MNDDDYVLGKVEFGPNAQPPGPHGLTPIFPSVADVDRLRIHQLERLVLQLSKMLPGPSPFGDAYSPLAQEMSAIIDDLKRRHPDV